MVSECCLTPNKLLSQQYQGKSKLHFHEMMMMSALLVQDILIMINQLFIYIYTVHIYICLHKQFTHCSIFTFYSLVKRGLGLWGLKPQLYHGGKIYWWRKLEITTDLPQVTDKLYHTKLYQVHLAMSRIQTHNFSAGRHRFHIGSCKSNHHTIMTTTALLVKGNRHVYNMIFWYWKWLLVFY